MKNYSNDVIEQLQLAIDKKDYQVEKKFTSYDDFPKEIYAMGIKVVLQNQNGMHSTIIMPDFGMCDAQSKEWKMFGLGKFYSKDWKSANKHLNAFTKYLELIINVKDINVVALLRELEVGTDIPDMQNEDISEEEAIANKLIYDSIANLIIDGKYYAIIKLYIDEYESYKVKSELEENVNFNNIEVEVNSSEEDETVGLEMAENTASDDEVELF